MTGNSAVRVRYAPSPTGVPHVGNVRTALFNWLFARHHGGSFIVRIEDTDVARTEPGAAQAIVESLSWLGLDWDEGPEPTGHGERGEYGPYFQSRRTEMGIYREHVDRLIASGHAYVCSCSPERLDEIRRRQRERGEPTRYDRLCRNLSDAERADLVASGAPHVVRFKIPLGGETAFDDLIRGHVSFQNSVLDDHILLKSDEYPTYHLAHVVDDHLMEISHVLRAEEWVSSTPRHVLLYRAFGWEPPAFAHLPIILGPDRAKLSKRHGATSLLEYRDRGYLPEAMMNFLTLLGWSLDDKTEIFSQSDLVAHFSIERIGSAGAIFNAEKLEWMNGVYLRQMPRDEVARRMTPFLESGLPDGIPRPIPQDYLASIVPLVQDRLKTLDQSAALTEFFFVDGLSHDPEMLVPKKMDRNGALAALETASARLEALADFDAATLEGMLRPLAEELGLKTGQLFGTLRVAVTGRTAAPPLFETMAVLGRERCLGRIRGAIVALRSPS